MGEKNRALLDQVPEMVTISDPEGRVLYANPATERVSGFAPEEFVGRDPFETIHPEDRPRCEEAFEELLRTPGLSLELEHRIRHKNGEWRWMEGTFVSLFDDPEVGGLLATVRDFTERRGAEEALKESEERYRLIVEGARDYAIITTDPEGTIKSWSPGAEAVFGWSAEEVLGRPGAITFAPEDREAGVPEKELAVASREGLAPDVRWHLRKDGSRVFIEGSTRVMRASGEGGGPRGFVKVGQDVTERRALEEERDRLRAVELTARAEASERERISRELHDRVAHTMVVAHQSLQLHAALARSDPERAAEKLERAAEATKSALEQTRHLAAQLARSGAQETPEGLGSALRDLLDGHAPPGVEATLSVEGDDASVPERVGEQAYLVMREAVRNAVAHSDCGRVRVSLEVEDAQLRGRVEDDGVGFDPRGEPDGGEGTSPAGMGLLSMRERTERLGGRLEIVSEPGRGTTVEVRIPLAD